MTQKVFATPTNDVVFKAIFGQEGDKEPLKFTDHLEIHVLELSKLDAYNRSIESELLINWAEFLSLGNEDELMTLKDRTDLPEAVLKAIEEYERIKDNPDLQWEALNRQIAIMDYIQKLDEVKAETIETMAKNMKALGSSPEFIAQVTGLDIENINKL